MGDPGISEAPGLPLVGKGQRQEANEETEGIN